MGFWSLLDVASMPILQMLIICVLGAFMATDYLKLLSPDARKSMNRVVFAVFTPSLVFASLAKSVTLQDLISWWFMPVNIGLTFLFGGIFGWIAVKILRPKPHLEGLIIATCSAGNLGNLLLILVPAICKEDGNPFGDHTVCASAGLSYVSLSMALGGIYIWTYTYHLIRSSAMRYKAMKAAEESSKKPNTDLDAKETSNLLDGGEEHVSIIMTTTNSPEDDTKYQTIESSGSDSKLVTQKASTWSKLLGTLHQILEELLAPPTLAAIIGLIFGAITWLKNLIIGDSAPLRFIQDSVQLLGNGTIPCMTLILGGNLTQGLRKAGLKPLVILAVVCVRYVILPGVGIGVIKAAARFGFLAADPLYHFVLMIQFTLPPAMNIGTMTQLFDVAQEECSVLFLWTYLVAAISLTVWSTVFMWILS
ncbi:Auxin efflux carrier family protein [Forsythia ovata]|uniref:Auxin efflux carrier family protein n=1 Tax=Forsythia ovata TaxID=205694 RepID=A0ABD1P1Z1_9LAMI